MKKCTKCNQTKELNAFYKDKYTRDGYRPDCRECNLEGQRNRYHSIPGPRTTRVLLEVPKGTTRAVTLRLARYGLSFEGYCALLNKQDSSCAICKVEGETLYIDHDHNCCAGNRSCGQCVRGLLCHRCNTMLGFALDNMDTLVNAAFYLSCTEVNEHSGSMQANE